MVCNQLYNILIKEKFRNCNLNVWDNHALASYFPPLYILNLNAASFYAQTRAGGVFDFIVMLVGSRIPIKGPAWLCHL